MLKKRNPVQKLQFQHSIKTFDHNFYVFIKEELQLWIVFFFCFYMFEKRCFLFVLSCFMLVRVREFVVHVPNKKDKNKQISNKDFGFFTFFCSPFFFFERTNNLVDIFTPTYHYKFRSNCFPKEDLYNYSWWFVSF